MSQTNAPSLRELEHHHAFIERHIGPNDAEIAQMLHVIGHGSLEAMTDAIVPGQIKSKQPLALPESITRKKRWRRSASSRARTKYSRILSARVTTARLRQTSSCAIF